MYQYGAQAPQQGGYYGHPQQPQFPNQQSQPQQTPAAQSPQASAPPTSRDLVNGEYVSVYPGQPAYQLNAGAKPHAPAPVLAPAAAQGYGHQYSEPGATPAAPATAPFSQQHQQQDYATYGAQYAAKPSPQQPVQATPQLPAASQPPAPPAPTQPATSTPAYGQQYQQPTHVPGPSQAWSPSLVQASQPAQVPQPAQAHAPVSLPVAPAYQPYGGNPSQQPPAAAQSMSSPHIPQQQQQQQAYQQPSPGVQHTETGFSAYQASPPVQQPPPPVQQTPTPVQHAPPPGQTASVPTTQPLVQAQGYANVQPTEPPYAPSQPGAVELSVSNNPAPWLWDQFEAALPPMPPAHQNGVPPAAPPVAPVAPVAPAQPQYPVQNAGQGPPVQQQTSVPQPAPLTVSAQAVPQVPPTQWQPNPVQSATIWPQPQPQVEQAAPAAPPAVSIAQPHQSIPPAPTWPQAQQPQPPVSQSAEQHAAYTIPPSTSQAQPPAGQGTAPLDPIAAAQAHLAQLMANQAAQTQQPAQQPVQQPPVGPGQYQTTQNVPPTSQPMAAPNSGVQPSFQQQPPAQQPYPVGVAVPNIPGALQSAPQMPTQPVGVPPPMRNPLSPQLVSQGVLNAVPTAAGFPPVVTPAVSQVSPMTIPVAQLSPPQATPTHPCSVPTPVPAPATILASSIVVVPQPSPPVGETPAVTSTALVPLSQTQAESTEEDRTVQIVFVPVTTQELEQHSPIEQPASPTPEDEEEGGVVLARPQHKRKALLIGINYLVRPQMRLRGCINDAKLMFMFLVKLYGYSTDDIVLLTDDQEEEDRLPTGKVIWAAMHWLVADAQPGDSFVFHFSGHGTRVRDTDGDEDDGYDECIVPLDWQQGNEDTLIIDDEMHDIMVKPLPAGAKLTAIFDSCHSGSALDLPYSYSTQGILKEPNMAKEAGKGLIKAVAHTAKGNVVGAGVSLFKAAKKMATQDRTYVRAMVNKTSQADVVSWSSSKDNQVSMEADGMPFGLMSNCFIKALAENPNQSYIGLLNTIRTMMVNDQQKPQLACSHPLDTRLPFFM